MATRSRWDQTQCPYLKVEHLQCYLVLSKSRKIRCVNNPMAMAMEPCEVNWINSRRTSVIKSLDAFVYSSHNHAGTQMLPNQ